MNFKQCKKYIDVMDWCEISYFIIQSENDLRKYKMTDLEFITVMRSIEYAEELKQKQMPSPSSVMSYNNMPTLRN